MSGWLALVGGAEWTPGCDIDAELIAGAGGAGVEVLVLPTAAAFERPELAVATATAWLTPMGARVTGLYVLNRADAHDPANIAAVRSAGFVYLSGGSPLHLRAVLKQTPLWDALVAAHNDGAVLAGSSAGAMVLGDPMVDPRGGAYTLGLGLVANLAVLPHADTWSPEKVHRTLKLAPAGVAVALVGERAALVRAPDGTWSSRGQVTVQGRTGEIALSAISPSD